MMKKSKGGIKSDKGQYATIRETVEFADINGNTGYNFNFNLSQFRRASALAPNFKWYKAVSVEWIIEPLFNTFQDSTSGSSMPYIYETMNRTQDTTGLNILDMQAMGCKPKKLIGVHKTKYTPNWCSPGLNSQTFKDPPGAIQSQAYAGLKAQYSYLACPDDVMVSDGTEQALGFYPAQATGFPAAGTEGMIANQVIYNGHTIWVDQEHDNAIDTSCARVVCNVVWAFKDPHYVLSPEKYVTVSPAKVPTV